MRAGVHACGCTRVCKQACARASACIHGCACIPGCAGVYVCMHAWRARSAVRACMCRHANVRARVYMHIYTRVCTHMRVSTFTRPLKGSRPPGPNPRGQGRGEGAGKALHAGAHMCAHMHTHIHKHTPATPLLGDTHRDVPAPAPARGVRTALSPPFGATIQAGGRGLPAHHTFWGLGGTSRGAGRCNSCRLGAPIRAPPTLSGCCQGLPSLQQLWGFWGSLPPQGSPLPPSWVLWAGTPLQGQRRAWGTLGSQKGRDVSPQVVAGGGLPLCSG